MIILFKPIMQKKIPNMKTPPHFENYFLNQTPDTFLNLNITTKKIKYHKMP